MTRMRQIVLDTETTGLEVAQGHRIIEIGCVELRNRRATGNHFHRYLNPERDVDAGARAVHGLSREDLAGKPRFAEIADEFTQFISGAELIIHNASFDVGFLDAEFARLPGEPPLRVGTLCQVLDTWGWRAPCTRASATTSTRSASATASTIRTASCTARCSTRAFSPTSISR